MKKILRKLSTILFLAFMIAIFVACENVRNNDNLTKITVSEVTHSVFYAPQYVAINLGFFKEEGLEIELVNSQGADKVMTAVLSNQAQIGFAGPESAIYVYNQGKEDYVQVFAQVTQRDGSFLVAREPDSNFEWSKLLGKHILPGRKGGVPYMALQYVLNKNGIDIETDLLFDNSISFDAMTGAFLGGVGDYVTIFEPTATSIELEGKGYIVASVGEAAGEIPYTAYFAKKSYIESNKSIIQAFTDSLYKGQKWVQSHTSRQVAEALAESFPETSIDVLEKVVERYKSINAWSITPFMTEESFERLQDVIENAGELETRANFNDIVNNTFAENSEE